MITIEYAKKRLAEIAELTDGWEFGEGIAPSRTSLERAEQVLDFAHKVGIQEMEVFPRADGAVEVHLYNDPGTLEVTCWTDGTASTLVDRPNEKPCLAHKVEFGGGALNTILEFAVWSSTAFSTHTTGLPKNYDTTVQASNPKKVESRSFARLAPSIAQPSEERPLVVEFDGFTPTSQPAFLQSYGSWTPESSVDEEWSSFSHHQSRMETFATMT